MNDRCVHFNLYPKSSSLAFERLIKSGSPEVVIIQLQIRVSLINIRGIVNKCNGY